MNSDKKTVLIFSEWYHPGYKAGGPITSLVNAVNLIGNDLSAKVVCGDRDYLESDPYQGVVVNKWVNMGKADVFYLSPVDLQLSKIKELIAEVNPDVIYLNGMFSKVFTIFPLIAAKGLGIKIVLAPRGMLAPAALQIKRFKKSFFLKMTKLFGIYSNVYFHATNNLEALQIKQHFQNPSIEIIENVPTLPKQNQNSRTTEKERNILKLYMVARIAPEKNIHFALKCLKEISHDITVNLKVIGSIYDKPYYERCQEIVSQCERNIFVDFLGAKTKDEILFIGHQSDFFYLPTAGENYGHAIVESLINNIPVIISDQTPWQELEVANLGFDLPLTEEVFVEKLNYCGEMSGIEYKQLYENIGNTVRSFINIDNLHKGYLKLFNDRD
ncbi:MAG: glycosyltransferase [Bacteroidota bacterium]